MKKLESVRKYKARCKNLENYVQHTKGLCSKMLQAGNDCSYPMYQVLKAEGQTVEEVGKVIYDTFEAMADYPKWLLRLVGSLKYNEKYVSQLKEAVAKTQELRYPGDWVATFIEGNGEGFDYGIDITECGIYKFYRAQGADELAPYLCLSDYVVSDAFERGLVRYKTLAEGAEVCDFRYKKGRETFVNPLREGWPPKFLNGEV